MAKLTPVLSVIWLALGWTAASATPAAKAAAAPSVDVRIILLPVCGSGADDREIGRWQERVRARPDEPEYYERLGWAFVGEARRTLDAGYYKLAEKTADVMEARFGANPSSALLRGHVLHNLHRFREAELVARQLVAERGLAFDYALLSDALMEQGKISEAVAACQREMTLKPGLEAYSRAANLRWLTGDLPGAIDAMEAAVKAGSPLDPANCAWTLVRLSNYHLQAGNSARSLQLAEAALKLLPEYPPGLLARGRARVALGEAGAAVPDLKRATALNPLPEYQWWLADTLRCAGRPDEAAGVETQLRRRGETADPRTLALFLATRGEDAATALRLAREELKNRQDVLTRDALAWALAASGDYAGAEATIRTVLAERTQDARLFLHAGEIELARGEVAEARASFEAARPFAGTLTPGERNLLDRRFGLTRTALDRPQKRAGVPGTTPSGFSE